MCTRYLVNEASIEKLHVILRENPQGVLYLRDELSGWIAQLEQRGRERERAFFLETWDGDGDLLKRNPAKTPKHAEGGWAIDS